MSTRSSQQPLARRELDIWTRRKFLAAVGAFNITACTGVPSSGSPADTLPPEGVRIYSESVQVSLADDSGENFLTARLCQYPEADVAWLWIACLVEGEFYSWEDNSVRTKSAKSVTTGSDEAYYSAKLGSREMYFRRAGKLAAPQSCEMSFESTSRPEIAAKVNFDPVELFTGLIPGRAEVFGHASANVSVNGRSVSFSGFGQWHEQQQSDPRFVTPFVYASLWGDGAFATFVQSTDGSGGYIIEPAGVRGFKDARFTPRGASRSVVLTGLDEQTAAFDFSTRHSYNFPIYGKPWYGSFVTGMIGDVPVSGFINTWRYPLG